MSEASPVASQSRAGSPGAAATRRPRREPWGPRGAHSVVRLRSTPASGSARQTWTVVAVLGLPIALGLLIESALLGVGGQDPGLLRFSSLLPLPGLLAVLVSARALPGLRTAFTVAFTGRVGRRAITMLLVVIAMVVTWNQLALLTGVMPLPRSDLDAGVPLGMRLVAYLGLAALHESVWRGILLPTLRARHGWARAAVLTGLVWGLLAPWTWAFGPVQGGCVVLATIGWSIITSTIIEDMYGGHLLCTIPFAWGILTGLFLLLGEETGVRGAYLIIAAAALAGAAAASWLYARSRRARGMDPYA